jgi:hypothetical protein
VQPGAAVSMPARPVEEYKGLAHCTCWYIHAAETQRVRTRS